MDPWVMVAIGAAVALAPAVLMRLFNGGEVLDARGRRRGVRWRSERRGPQI